jgi:hypothetical protein
MRKLVISTANDNINLKHEVSMKNFKSVFMLGLMLTQFSSWSALAEDCATNDDYKTLEEISLNLDMQYNDSSNDQRCIKAVIGEDPRKLPRNYGVYRRQKHSLGAGIGLAALSIAGVVSGGTAGLLFVGGSLAYEFLPFEAGKQKTAEVFAYGQMNGVKLPAGYEKEQEIIDSLEKTFNKFMKEVNLKRYEIGKFPLSQEEIIDEIRNLNVIGVGCYATARVTLGVEGKLRPAVLQLMSIKNLKRHMVEITNYDDIQLMLKVGAPSDRIR